MRNNKKQLILDLRQAKKQALVNFLSWFEYVSAKRVLTVFVLAMMVVQIVGITAYEGFVANVTAEIVNGQPTVFPAGGDWCEDEEIEVTITATSTETEIIYTLDGSDPECGVNGEVYSAPFSLSASTTLKTRGCLDGAQSKIVTEYFNFSYELCQPCEVFTVINFDDLVKGTEVRDQYRNLGVRVQADNFRSDHPDKAIIFDSSNPTGADSDLATPGYGIDNTEAQNEILIIAEDDIDENPEDGLVDDPDDEERGGIIRFDFATSTYVETLGLLDIDLGEQNGQIRSYDENGDLLKLQWIFGKGDNSFQEVSVSTSSVKSLELELESSGALTEIKFCEIPKQIECGDGIVDEGEECDDGNQVNGDGCNNDCQWEDECKIRDICTQTQGGWGQTCNGGNVGCLRDNYWDEIIGTQLEVGIGNRLIFTSSEAVENFLPQGGAPGSLNFDYTDPLFVTEAGVLASQVTALKLNVLYSDYGVGLIGSTTDIKLGDLEITQGVLAGMTVRNFLELAEKALGGDISVLTDNLDYGDINDIATAINENFVDCSADNGYLAREDCFSTECGNGIVEYGEECDDGNDVDDDNCDNECQINICEPEEEICDYVDNDCDGVIDNVFEDAATSTVPVYATLDEGQMVTHKVVEDDKYYASESVSGTSSEYIYLKWEKPDLPDGAIVGTTTIELEHRQDGVTTTLEFWNGWEYVWVCDLDDDEDWHVDTCDLTDLVKEATSTDAIDLRINIKKTGNCHEDLDWARLITEYQKPINCFPECGDGWLDENEECDDGNLEKGDGCDNECQFEECVLKKQIEKTPKKARLHYGQNVTNKVQESDDKYAIQPVLFRDRFIYFEWKINTLSTDSIIGTSSVFFEHQEDGVAASVEWFDGDEYTKVCDLPYADTEQIDSCDLTNYLRSQDDLEEIKIRLRLEKTGNCHEKVNWAYLIVNYYEEGECEADLKDYTNEKDYYLNYEVDDQKENNEEGSCDDSLYCSSKCDNDDEEKDDKDPPGEKEEAAPVVSIALSGENENISWVVDGYSAKGFKVVWSASSSPTYPTRPGDKYHYYSDPERDYDTLTPFDGDGEYYVRVCEYLGGKCGVYSNEIVVYLGEKKKKEDDKKLLGFGDDDGEEEEESDE